MAVNPCALTCEELEQYNDLLIILRDLLRKDGSGCVYIDARDASGNPGSPAQILVPSLAGGDVGGFQDNLLIGSTGWTVFQNNTRLLSSEYSVDDITGTITFTPALNSGDEVQIQIFY